MEIVHAKKTKISMASITPKKELENVVDYLYLEKMRYEERLGIQ